MNDCTACGMPEPECHRALDNDGKICCPECSHRFESAA